MITCSECGTGHYPGALFCETCGAAVHPAAKAHVAAQKARRKERLVGERRPPLMAGDDRGSTQMDAKTGELRIFVPAYRQRLTIRAAVINVGRADPELGFKPELDLTPFGGLEKGVSRRHATIQWDGRGYVLIDQHSSNGTWLEGVRLAVGQAHRLPPRAAVRFGDLLVQLSTAD